MPYMDNLLKKENLENQLSSRNEEASKINQEIETLDRGIKDLKEKYPKVFRGALPEVKKNGRDVCVVRLV